MQNTAPSAVRPPHWSATFTLGDLAPLHRKYPGLVKVLTAADVPGNNGFGIYPDVKDQPALAAGEVRYRGEAVVALVGDYATVFGIRDDELPIRWQVRDPVQGFDAPLSPGAPQLHKDRPGNLLARGYGAKGDAEAALAGIEYIVPVAAFSDPERVKELTSRLAAAKLPYYTEPIATAKGRVTRVRAGPFDSREAAEKAHAKLKGLGLKPGNVTTKS